jgi:hypothetical protein
MKTALTVPIIRAPVDIKKPIIGRSVRGITKKNMGELKRN